MDIRCITFDLDDTLWAIYPVIHRAETHFLAWMREHQPRIVESHSEESLFAHRQEFFREFPDLQHDMTRMRKNWMARLADEHGYAADRVEEGFEVFWKQRNIVELFDHTHEMLDHVSSHYRVGAVTNGNADIDHIGIGHYFDFFLKSSEVGVSKPHPEIFSEALRHAQCLPREVVHVGDDPVNDVEGAKRVGMRTVWVNVLDREYAGEHQPDATITRLDQLPDTLALMARDQPG